MGRPSSQGGTLGQGQGIPGMGQVIVQFQGMGQEQGIEGIGMGQTQTQTQEAQVGVMYHNNRHINRHNYTN
jgi:hypothetical protein